MATCNDAFSEQMKLEITSFFSLDHFCLDQFVLDLIKFDPHNWVRTFQNSRFHYCAPPNILWKRAWMKIRMQYATSEKVLPNCDHNSLTPTYFVTIWVLEICFSILLSSIMHNIEWYIGRLKMKCTFSTNIIQ